MSNTIPTQSSNNHDHLYSCTNFLRLRFFVFTVISFEFYREFAGVRITQNGLKLPLYSKFLKFIPLGTSVLICIPRESFLLCRPINIGFIKNDNPNITQTSSGLKCAYKYPGLKKCAYKCSQLFFYTLVHRLLIELLWLLNPI